MEVKLSNNGTVELITTVASWIISLFLGTWIPLMTTLLVLNLSDIATGVLKGSKKHELGSRELHRGIRKKVGQWILIIVANSVDVVAFGNMPVAKTGVVGMLIGVEGTSIVENLAEIGVPIPESIKKYLVQIRQDSEGNLPEEIDKKVTNVNITIDN